MRRLSLAFIVLLACSTPILKVAYDRHRFYKAKRYSMDAHNYVFGVGKEGGASPLSEEMFLRHKAVVTALESARFPLAHDPILIYALVRGDVPDCDVVISWIGQVEVTGMQLDYTDGNRCSLLFEAEKLERLASFPGLAREHYLTWSNEACEAGTGEFTEIQSISLLGSNGRPIGNSIRPRTIMY